MFDVTIIGSGVVGASIARELARYELKVCVVEKSDDVANGTTKANSAIIHAGFDAKPGTLKGMLNAKGNEMFDTLAKELDFPFKRNGSLVLCFEEEGIEELNKLKEQGDVNGVPGVRVLTKEEVKEIEPNISNEVVGALYAPSGAIVCPYELTIALCENACENGVEFKLETEVKDIKKNGETFVIETNKGNIETKLVINASGVHADNINNMISNDKMEIIARRGEYCLFDKVAGAMVTKTIFQLPTKLGKGILVTPTVDGNLLVGPNAIDINDKDDLNTTKEGLDEVIAKGRKSVMNLPMNKIITSFSGLRAHNVNGDFVIGEAKDVEGFINAAGIESPGLSSAPAIGEMVKNIVIEKLNPKEKNEFNPIRKATPKFRELNNEERKKLIATNPLYGKIICRCEEVTEGEIVDSIKRPLGARSLDGVKRRTRSGMGGCQGGFCSAPIVDILARELNIPRTAVRKSGENSEILIGQNKDNL